LGGGELSGNLRLDRAGRHAVDKAASQQHKDQDNRQHDGHRRGQHLGLNTWATLTFDYQLIGNPGYNADRGPVSVFSGRLHAQF
jgi:hypothetical protein